MEARYSMEGHGALPLSQASTSRSYEKNENPSVSSASRPQTSTSGPWVAPCPFPLIHAHALLCPCHGSWPSHMLPLALTPSTHLGWPMALLNRPHTAAPVPCTTTAAATGPHCQPSPTLI